MKGDGGAAEVIVAAQARFDSGYGSTTDSAETLNGISSDPNGDLVPDVSFISQQSTTESATRSTCTE